MAKEAARVGDQTAHGSPLFPGKGSEDVIIEGKPAWRTMIDTHTCPVVKGGVSDGGGVVLKGSRSVVVNFQMACRVADEVTEIPGGPNPIVAGCPSVIIGD